jgi:hypothetical protein
MTRIAKNVERGAVFLDAELPGWDDNINLERLQLGSTCYCVLGQQIKRGPDAAGRYQRVAEWLEVDPYGVEARRLGFMVWGRQTYRQLTRSWKLLIERRREGR